MVDFNAYLQRKYDIMQQNANSESTRANATSNLTNAQASIIPGESRARIANTNAQTDLTNKQASNYEKDLAARLGLIGAQTNDLNVRAGLAPGLANSLMRLQGASAGLDEERTKYIGPTAQSEIGYRAAQAGLTGAQTEEARASTAAMQDPDLGEFFRLGIGSQLTPDQLRAYLNRPRRPLGSGSGLLSPRPTTDTTGYGLVP